MHSKQKMYLLQALAVCAYLTIILQWLTLFIPYMPGIIRSGAYQSIVADKPTNAPVEMVQSQPAAPMGVVIIAGIILAIVMIALILVSVSRAPKAIGKTGQQIVHVTSAAILPVATRHRHVSQRQRKRLTAEIGFGIKIFAGIVPIIIIALVPFGETPFEISRLGVAVVLGAAGALIILLVSAQAVMARLWRINSDMLW